MAATPSIDIHTIGAGGGTIAGVDTGSSPLEIDLYGGYKGELVKDVTYDAQRSTLKDDPLQACITGKVKAWRFNISLTGADTPMPYTFDLSASAMSLTLTNGAYRVAASNSAFVTPTGTSLCAPGSVATIIGPSAVEMPS